LDFQAGKLEALSLEKMAIKYCQWEVCNRYMKAKSIKILVTANNFILMFVGRESVSICSYLLIGFWFTRITANQSSISVFLTNRVGDCFLTISMFTIL
jgi:NADH:ubiquinone oxidoreductase subunit 5 (subunit L)/multisubunit Na+/H+ antiporter MnhA subunit